MTETQHEAGISPTLGVSALGLSAAQLAIPDLLASPEDLPTARDHTYRSNEDLWHALIGGHERASMVVQLHDFWLSEWFPLRPGLFHTDPGSARRSQALRHLLSGPGLVDSRGQPKFESWFGGPVAPELIERLRPDSTFVFDPHGKAMMLDGGVGCVRLKAKDLPGGRVWFMGASSSPVAHEGVPVAVPDSLHAQWVDELAERGALRCTITGRLTHTPPDLDPLYRDLVGLPQVYVVVEQLASSPAPPGTPFVATGAVLVGASPHTTPQSESDIADGIYAAYVSFGPTEAEIAEAADWLKEVYVEQLLRGRVLVDFDEHTRRFKGGTFDIERLMTGHLEAHDVGDFLSRCGAANHTREQFSVRVETLNQIIGDITLSGRDIVFAGPGGAAAAGHGTAKVGLVERAKSSTWAKIWGALALAAVIAATILLVAGVTDISVAGYVLAVVGVCVAVVPVRGGLIAPSQVYRKNPRVTDEA
jgi:hypothetical protein